MKELYNPLIKDKAEEIKASSANSNYECNGVKVTFKASENLVLPIKVEDVSDS